MNDGPALVLFSGGQDSTTSLLWALTNHQFTRVDTVSFDYGQRHNVELEQAAMILDEIDAHQFTMNLNGPVRPFQLDLTVLGDLAGAALTNPKIAVQELADDEGGNVYAAARGLPSTYIPGRNLLFLSAAAALAAKVGAQHLVTGICAMDRAGYPDCRAEFAAAMTSTLRVGLDWPEIEVHTPCLYATKADTWRLAQQSAGQWGVNLVRDLSHTCYQGDRTAMHDWGAGCGECPACRTRAEGWTEFLGQTRLAV